MNLKRGNARYIFLLCLTGIMFVSYAFVLFKMQILDNAYYKEQSAKRIYSTETITASRGNIYDRNGQLLVTNETVYTLKLSRALLPTDRQNEIILNLCKLLTSKDETYFDTLPFTTEAPFAFADNEDAAKQIASLIKTLKLGDGAPADEVFAALCKRYKIESGLSDADKRIIAGVRYEMERSDFSSANPFILASDIAITTVTSIKELGDEFPGVDVDTESKRVYTTPYLASHLLGRVGKIYAEEYEELSEKGYKMNDYVGKDGIEKAMEDSLHGTDGIKVIERDSAGNVLGVTTAKEPVSGNNIILTLDKDLQQIAQTSLEQTIKNIAQGGRNKANREGADACAGAAVVLDVNSGEVLACVSAPNYDLTTYSETYNVLANDKLLPLFNRALSGTYAPGSTFKMATGIAGLEEGVITPNTKITDQGRYTKYPDYKPRCWIYSDTGGTHGSIDVSQALEKSCNYFFYETADIMGIDFLNAYCKLLGLGEKTGIELPEKAGTLAGPEYRKQIESQWYPGDTLQAAIGQSDNLFTPIQLANYVATIVNGGTRYKTHLVKSINDSATGTALTETTTEVVETLNMKEENYHAIMYGMKLAAQSGTASNLFSNYKVGVGAKTGTASVPSGTANGVFVAFAPYENPEIAICVVVEHGAHGNYVGAVAKAVFDEYFKDNSTAYTTVPEAQLLP